MTLKGETVMKIFIVMGAGILIGRFLMTGRI